MRLMAQSAVFAAFLFSVAGARASVIAYEGFGNGPRANLDGSAGGSGWTAPWTDSASALVTSVGGTGLSYPLLRQTAGGAVTPAGGSFNAASYSRPYAPIPTPANHIFISFLLRPEAGSGTFGGLSFGGYSMIGQPLTYNTYGMRLGRYQFADSGIPVIEGQTALLVLELEVMGAQTAYRLYVNPPLSQGKPAFPSAHSLVNSVTLPTALMLSNDGGFTTDEIRVATTWAESVPPPGGACFVLQGPAPAISCAGGTANFSVSPSGSTGTVGYQWYRGPFALSDGPTGFGSSVAGSTASHLAISGVGQSDLGFYFCVVTDGCGSVTSAPAVLSICPADFNCDGGVDGDDVIEFFALWDSGQARADFNGDGGVDGDDVIAFFGRWDGGC